MKVVRTIDELRKYGPSRGTVPGTGLVPTMGAFHAGHLALFAAARAENEVVVVSLFVNPAQFGPDEDLDRYPRDEARDAKLADEAGVDLLFAPSADEMYPDGYGTWVDVGDLGRRLEGEFRPDHFRGVATVCLKLFNIVRPDRAYFGQKDAQQVAVVRRLVRDLDLGVEVRVAPTVREEDGLALSSRNVYLSSDERKAAASLSAALREAANSYAAGERDPEALRGLLITRLTAEPLVSIDYAELVDPATFQKPGSLAVVAARLGKTRLIDNHDLRLPFPK